MSSDHPTGSHNTAPSYLWGIAIILALVAILLYLGRPSYARNETLGTFHMPNWCRCHGRRLRSGLKEIDVEKSNATESQETNRPSFEDVRHTTK